MRRRRLWVALVLLGLLNAVAFLHAWRFTHFTDEPGRPTANPGQLGPGQKLGVLLTGIRNPKSVNEGRPPFAYTIGGLAQSKRLPGSVVQLITQR